MNKIIMGAMAVALGSMAFVSCSSDVDELAEAQGKKTVVFDASQPEGKAATRTTINSNGDVVWLAADEIAVFDGTNKNKFTIWAGAGTTTAKIWGEADPDAQQYVAVYPYYRANTYNTTNGILNVTVPTVQNARENSYAPLAGVMYAVSDGSKLEFQHVCAYIKFTTTQAHSSITFEANEFISNRVRIRLSNGKQLDPTEDANGSNIVTLQPASGSDIPAGTYYVAVRVRDNYTNFKMTVNPATTDGTAPIVKVASSVNSLNTAGDGVDLGTIDL